MQEIESYPYANNYLYNFDARVYELREMKSVLIINLCIEIRQARLKTSNVRD